jgi:type VI secretion system protein ImpF
MAELTTQEKLQPALLDRLTDTRPEQSQESREERVISDSALKQAVLRDLQWLFNSTQLSSDDELTTLPHVSNSVLNFGMPAMAGQLISTLDRAGLEHMIKNAILNFESRILPNTLEVALLTSEDAQDHHNVLEFHIIGQLWAQPMPLELYLKTSLDLETGQVELDDLG